MKENRRHIRLPRALVSDILDQARNASDREVCGIVSGRDGEARRVYPITNVAALPERRFLMDAHEQIAAMRSIREHGEELLGIYHSHPNGSALPSAEDLQDIGYPDALYLIVALNIKRGWEIRGYRVKRCAAEEIELETF